MDNCGGVGVCNFEAFGVTYGGRCDEVGALAKSKEIKANMLELALLFSEDLVVPISLVGTP